MARATFHFPRGFLWGTATASHQVEGNNKNNNWWAWEGQPGRILQGHKSGLACDWWGGRWRDDFDRAADAGQNAHRLSIEWSRVQPSPDRWDESALDHYRLMARGLVDRNMTPMVTLHHFSNPIWLEEIGGWENEKIVEYFEAFVQKTVEALKEYVTLWCTINEPNVLAYNGYLTGAFPPGKKDLSAVVRVMTNMVKAHAVAFQAIRKIQPVSRVGLAIHYRPQLPHRAWFPLDRWIAGVHTRWFNDFFPRALKDGVLRFPFLRRRLPEVKGTQDYLGLNYYTQDQVVFSLLRPGDLFGRRFFPPDVEISASGMISNRPEGLYAALKWARQFIIPIIVTENGVDDADDQLRPRYLCQHIHALWRAVNESWPIKGYFHWTLVDNFEWERGWTQRFGLWALDPETQARQKRPSADLFAEICKSNSLSAEVVARFVPEIVEEMFPG